MLINEKIIREWIEEISFWLRVDNWRIFSIKQISNSKIDSLWWNYILVIQNWKIKMIESWIKDLKWIPFKHSDLAWNKNVDFAWLINFNQWKISVTKWITNNTWHYKCNIGDSDKIIIKKAFDNIGYDTTDIYNLINNFRE
jgi:hypothetical protein